MFKKVFRARYIFPLVLLGGGLTLYKQYQSNPAFRNIKNVGYAGINMAYIYKYSNEETTVKHVKASTYLRDALKQNGGIYVKLGQLIATLDVIVPDQYREIMTTLTRSCPKTSFQDVKLTIEEELKYPLDVIFKSFQKEPISSASIAQVHRAVLLSGKTVAVKVQHRRLQKTTYYDLQLMKSFVKIAKYLFQDDFKYEWLVDQFEKNCKIQLNFEKEAENMLRTKRFLKVNNFTNIAVPQLYLSPTKRVIVMEFIDGVHIDEIKALKEMNVNLKRMGALFSHMIIKMIHKEGFVHADTHSGNLMVRKKNGKDQLVIIDHGLYQELNPEMKKEYNNFWLGLILNDSKIYQPAARHLGTSNPKLLCSMLTSKTFEELDDKNRKLFDLNPSSDRQKIMDHAAKRHHEIVSVLSDLRRQFLLLLKVNEFARTIQNMMEGRKMGVYEDIAYECVQNSDYGVIDRYKTYLKMKMAH